MISRPDPGLYERAQALYERSVPLLVQGRLEEALPLCRDAVAAHRLLVEDHDDHLLDYAIVLNNHATVLQRTGRLRDAEPPLREELEVRRRLAAGNDPQHRDELARVLSVLAVLLASLDRPDEGEPPALESVRIRGELADADPATYRLHRGASLVDLARVRFAAERFDEARATGAEALEILQGIPGEDHLGFLAGARHIYGAALDKTGAPEAAIEQLAEAVAYYRRLPDEPQAAGSLMAYGRLLADAGRTREAADTLIEAIAVSQRHSPAYFLETSADLLKALYQAAPTAVADRWTQATGTTPPRWLTGSRRRWRRSP